MITELCQELRNWFDTERIYGTFTISDGKLEPSPNLLDGQYYRIIGSIFNDGVHQFGVDEDSLINESFEGSIWCMSVPKELIKLMKDIDAYNSSFNTHSPFVSETFGDYKYSKRTANGKGGIDASWQHSFKKELNKWRKI